MISLKVNHIGYLVKKTDTAKVAFLNLGYRIMQDTMFDSIRNVHLTFLEKDGYVVELIAPADKSSVVYGLLKKYKNSPYHICYETPNFERDLEALRSAGYLNIDEPTPAPAFSNREVVFLMHPSLGMIELLATPESDSIAINESAV